MQIRFYRSFWFRILLVLLFSLQVLPSSAASLPEKLTYKNPPGPRIPDPFVLRAANGLYYAYGTTNFRAWSSKDLVSWQALGNVYQTTKNTWGLGSWWAPEVVEYGGKYYLYYTADFKGSSKRIGVAVSDQPNGPFADPYARPLLNLGYGVIDPHVFIDDDGRKYLYYSRAMSEYEVSPGRFESHIYVIELGDDMISVKGEPVLLTRPEQSWELQTGGRSFWNEGAAVFKRNGVYYMMWSANSYAGRRYAVGYATAPSPLGPFTKWANNPILSADPWGTQLSGPGHNSVTMSPDGTEWYIVYHTHVDPAQGGGTRQINADRMGFRADGSIYVNGPSLTPQPTPSGNTELRNIARDATVSTSSTKAGRRPQAVTDGEIAFDSRFERYDWVANGESAGAWAQLTWSRERRISTVFLYDSALNSRKIKRGHVIFSDGTRVDDIAFPTEPGAAAIVPAPDKGIDWIRFVVDELAGDGLETGLSEIYVLGYPLGEDLLGGTWISSPQPGTTLRASAPITVQGSLPQGVTWSIELDDKQIYEGNQLPTDLAVNPAALAPGQHTVQVKAKGAAGELSSLASTFEAQHLQVTTPRDGQVIQGLAAMSAELTIAPEDVERVAVSISSVENGDKAQQIFTGANLPPQLLVDTLAFADGVYNLRFDVLTKAGIHSVQTRQATITNWLAMDDPFQPPTESGWFGKVEHNLTTTRSSGWSHSTDNADDFMGDAERLRRRQPTAEYLEWSHPRLRKFTITLFTKEPNTLKQNVTVSLSADGQKWAPVAYNLKEMASNTAGWLKMELTGVTPDGIDAGYIRIDLADAPSTSAAFTDVQLGHVSLVGRTQ